MRRATGATIRSRCPTSRPFTRDVPIYLDGLGTVQASATVTVKPMIDGKLNEVRFTEGQDVHVGDVLAIIDPRTYQAALDQAVAKKRQDESLLANARLDLVRYQKLAATAYTSAPAGRHAEGAGGAGRGAGGAGSGADRQCADQSELYRDHGAGGRAHRHSTGGCRQHRACRGCHRAGGADHAEADQRGVHPAAAGAAGRGHGAGAGEKPQVLALPQTGTSGANGNDPGRILDTGMLTVLDNQVDPSTGTIKLKASFPTPNWRCGRGRS